MKRYRALVFDFDTRSHFLEPPQEHWEDKVKELHLKNQESIINELKYEFGEYNFELKLKNFVDLGYKPFSLLAYHNRFLEQCRRSFTSASYYPALAGACALGERILNHLILKLRDNFVSTNEYKDIYRKNSFDNWDKVINALFAWKVLLPEAKNKFIEMKNIRNNSIHFSESTDANDREESLQAIKVIQEIVSIQFSVFGKQPWVLSKIPGEIYIKQEYENNPFVNHFILPSCAKVGYQHKIESLIPQIKVNDNFTYVDKEITDDEYCELRKNHQ